MPKYRQRVIETTGPERLYAKGSSAPADLLTSYPNSPINQGEGVFATDETMRQQYDEFVNGGEVDDKGKNFGVVNVDYGPVEGGSKGAPNLEEVETGGGGLPGTPYAPNVASPAVSDDPTTIPEAGAAITAQRKGTGGPFVGSGTGTSPKESAATISGQSVKIGSLQSGTSTPGST